MKTIFEQMGGTYRQEGDYLIPNLTLPDEPEYQIGKYGRMRRSYLKEHRPILYTNLLTSGTLHRHLAEIDQACNERMVRTPLRNDSRTVEVRHPDRRKQTPLPLVRQLEKLAWGPACCQSPRRLFYSIMPLRFLMVSPSIRMI